MKTLTAAAAALALAGTAGVATAAAPAAVTYVDTTVEAAFAPVGPLNSTLDGTTYEHHKRWHRRGGGNQRNNYREQGYRDYGEPVYRNTRVWEGRDGRMYCRKSDGTTGLIIGAAAGALLGREIDGGRDRTVGTILGGAAGALLGKRLDNGYRCR